ncbi:ABC transporter substrate-binding protein [Streptomyces sp. NBC_01264]|uniref:ABC transporter substrate-binding protein n=1 Tax=Streptomyces sp. NBC_01264 TaxID=2903804 RepID=UPI00224E7400|nr:extracellular solute-binding protein [Streptomyces sp. NBC_01264]MCX4775467.1 extracellular solute-binding protein [Streptomyces sp. NBC_01264]
MRAKRRGLWTSGAGCLAMVMLAAGCGTVSDPGSAKVVLRVVAADYGDSRANSSEPYWKELGHSFEQAHPGVRVEVSVLSWNDVDAKVAEMVRAGHAPDIAQIGAYADYAAAGKLYAADELLSVRTEADLLTPLAQAGRIRSAQYGLPFVASTRLMFYNTKLLEDAGVITRGASWQPKSWDALTTAAKKLKSDGVRTPIALPLGPEEAQAESMQWMLAGGGGMTNDSEAYVIDSSANVKTFEFLRDDLVGAGLTGPDEPGKLDRQEAFDAFTRGDVGILNGHPTLVKQATAKGVKLGMVALPAADGSEPQAMGVADWVMAFKNGHPKESGLFLDFLYEEKNVTAFTSKYGLLPVTTSGYRRMLASDDPGIAPLKVFLRALPSSRLYPVGKKSWASVSADFKKNIGAAVRPGALPAKVLADIAQGARKADK